MGSPSPRYSWCLAICLLGSADKKEQSVQSTGEGGRLWWEGPSFCRLVFQLQPLSPGLPVPWPQLWFPGFGPL